MACSLEKSPFAARRCDSAAAALRRRQESALRPHIMSAEIAEWAPP